MRTIIAGGRGIADYAAVCQAIKDSGFVVTLVISGGAKGVDTLGERWANENGRLLLRLPADWAKHGRAAGPIRNREMADAADALIAVWDGLSRGTGDMIRVANRKGLRVYVHLVGEGKEAPHA